jgi:iron complex outermembrane receptor protein
MNKHVAAVVIGGSLAIAALPAGAQEYAQVGQLKTLSIEELANVEVTSVSKRAETLSTAPAAIYVITNEDIMRSAASSLPEVLRQTPNLTIQQIDARQYSISARGFNGYETANKMLALIDGRTIYTPLFSGILWELHQPLLEDIEQIEVVSGPGGTLYGPNAVNGVISIASKTAFDTLGGLARATVGANQHSAALRYGAGSSEGAIRFYGNYYDRGDQPSGAITGGNDRLRGYQLGFRGDFGSEESRFTIQGDHFDSEVATLPGDGEKGQNVLARWTRALGDESAVRIQAYYDDYRRRFLLVRDELETFDVEAQVNTRIGRHQLVAGAGLRTTKDAFINRLNAFVVDPERRRLWIGNGFVQDRFAVSDTLSVIGGVKLEESTFTGLQVLPNLRVSWQRSPDTLLWAAVSRAVRTPSRIDRQLVNLPILAQATGFRTEKLTAIEAGYRGQPAERIAMSTNVFFNIYDDLRTTEFAPGRALPIRLANSLYGTSWGVEAWATAQPLPSWRLRFGVATLVENFKVRAGRTDLTGGESTGNNPSYRVTARSQADLTSRLGLDVGLRAVDQLDRFPTPAYIEADARLGWRATAALELYVAGTNLLREDHAESNDPKRGQRIERSVALGTRLLF